jgi:hypothetical protein
MNTDPDPDPIQIHGFMTKNRKTAGKKLDIILIKNCNLPIPRHPYRMSVQATGEIEPPALQNMKYLFLFLLVIFALLDPVRIQIQNPYPDPLN